MQLFIDSANIDEIATAASWGVIDGVTTNPTLVAKEGKSYSAVARRIVKLINGPMSAEVQSLDTAAMLREAAILRKIHRNIVIKIPMCAAGIAATKKLSVRKIPVNVTLIFSANQALLAAKAGAAYVSPFIGRLDDAGEDGMQLIRDIVDIFCNYDFSTKVLAASIRHPRHITEAALAGADVATVPFGILQKLFDHPLTEKGIATFVKDYKSIPA